MQKSRSALMVAAAAAMLSMAPSVQTSDRTSVSSPSVKHSPIKAGSADHAFTKMVREAMRGSGAAHRG